MSENNSKTLYLFVDESGNFDFSPNGTKYFVLSCLCTFLPVREREKIIDLRYRALKNGIDQEFFHATEDSQDIRNKVFDIIKNLKDDFEIHSVVAQKNKANSTLYIEEYKKRGKAIRRIVGAEFYQRACRTLLQYIFNRPNFQHADRIIVVLGAIFTKEKQSLICRTLKKYLKEKCLKSFEIYFHQAKADINCQIADYCGWAIAIKWERKEDRSFILINDKVKSEFEMFKSGNIEYYSYK
ncbi:DUF3800 domain-containing protein [Patescibacteria group bacterium]|nr:DUF3800 domain-containing protein [Patescibacteria group bacterium]MBU2220210.1 DUF3800 domain-containing protein [Patescibacteria group bacterium]MBU2265009.1 DUF3800 domain-containing protein [Patescibacteria group bacterium]